VLAQPDVRGSDWLMQSLVRASFHRTTPQHQVTISTAFALGKYLVTRKEFSTFVQETGYSAADSCSEYVHLGRPKGGGSWRNPGFEQSDNDPVVCVSWRDAKAYITWLNGKIGPEGASSPYNLPTEAEWEFAARANTKTLRWWGDPIGSNNANCAECGSVWDRLRTSPVGSFRPNPFGLYDMLGNASEVVQDCWHPDYNGAPTDGSAWLAPDCSLHPTRGDGWFGGAWGLIPALRGYTEADQRNNGIGFRVAKTLSQGN
jgi:formylglycine-generating enzyme required for sulfatase activity